MVIVLVGYGDICNVATIIEMRLVRTYNDCWYDDPDCMLYKAKREKETLGLSDWKPCTTRRLRSLTV